MKLRTREWLAVTLLCLLAAVLPNRLHAQNDGLPASGETPPPLGAATPLPPSQTPPDPPDKLAGKPAKGGDKSSKDSPKPVRVKPVKEIPFPLTVGSLANDLKIPEVNAMGKLLDVIMAAKANRIDNEHVQMQEMKMDLFHPDGKEDFHIILPTSIFNLKTHIIASEDPVTVRTEDFELIGDKMEFNTVDRTGELTGHVHMTIHNLKQVANLPQPSPTTHE